MSVINKKPYIEKVLETLEDEEKETLVGLINGGVGETVFKSYINPDYSMSTEDEGIYRIALEVENKVFTGYLIYNDYYCVIAVYNGLSQKMESVKLDYENKKYEVIKEELSIEEFRRILTGGSGSGSGSGTEVIANPTLTGDEEELTGIEIDGTKYSVPQGSSGGGSASGEIEPVVFDGMASSYQAIGVEPDTDMDFNFSKILEDLTDSDFFGNDIIDTTSTIYSTDVINTDFKMIIAHQSNNSGSGIMVLILNQGSVTYPFHLKCYYNDDEFKGHSFEFTLKDWGTTKTSLTLGELFDILINKGRSQYIAPDSTFWDGLEGHFDINNLINASQPDCYANAVLIIREGISDAQIYRFRNIQEFINDMFTEWQEEPISSSSSSSTSNSTSNSSSD